MRYAAALLLSAVLLAAPARAQDRPAAPPAPFVPPAPAVPAEPAVPLIQPDAAPADRLHFDVDFLYWFLERMRVPSLLTTGTPASGGVLGELGTETVYGDDRIESRHDRYVGVRLLADYWFDDDRTVGINGSAFFLERDSSNFTVPWGSIPFLARPYVDATTGTEKAIIIAGPAPGVGDLTGAFNAYSRMELYGEDANMLYALARHECWKLDALVGLRFLQMRERLDITGVSEILPADSVLLSATDHFDTFDKYYGVQAGLTGEAHWGPWFVEGKVALSIGGDDQEIRTYGNRIEQAPGVRLTQDYGILVLPSNRGTFERGAFDFVTDTEINVGCDLTRHCRVRLGYSILTWLNPVRPGDQIAPINLAQVAPGAPPFTGKPSVPFKEDAFWAQGANVGIELRW